PLGELVGNAVEVREAVEALRGERPGRFLDLCLTLTGHMAALAGLAADPEAGRRDARRALERGDGLERFRQFVAAQGGDPRVADDLSLLPPAPLTPGVQAPRGRGGARLARSPRLVPPRGGDPRVADDLSLLPQAPLTAEVQAPQAGWLAAVDAEAVGRVAAAPRAGRPPHD